MPDYRIIIAAQNASTEFGGEAILPVHYFRILKARGADVHLIAHERNRRNLEEYFEGDLSNIHLIADTIWHRTIWNIGKRFPEKIKAQLFNNLLSLTNELFQRRKIADLLKGADKAIVHVPIPVSPRAPTMIHSLGVPVIIGPMNGGMSYPPGYEDLERRSERTFSNFGKKLSSLANTLIPGKHRAALLLVANDRTRDNLPPSLTTPIQSLVENGVDLSLWSPKARKTLRKKDDPFRLAFVGRLVPLKAVEVTLDAINLVRQSGIDARLEIIGDGESRPEIESHIAKLNLQDHVTFHGFVKQAACADLLGSFDALILNSVHECGGAVVLEAMAMGLPVIGSDWGGPADYIDDSCGYLVHPTPRDSFAHRLATPIAELASDPAKARKMGKAGRAKVEEEFDWDRKVDTMVALYEDVLAARG